MIELLLFFAFVLPVAAVLGGLAGLSVLFGPNSGTKVTTAESPADRPATKHSVGDSVEAGASKSRRLDLYAEWVAEEQESNLLYTPSIDEQNARYAEERRAAVRRAIDESGTSDRGSASKSLLIPTQAAALRNRFNGQRDEEEAAVAAALQLCQSKPEQLLLHSLISVGQLRPSGERGKFSGSFVLELQATIKTSTWLRFHCDFLIDGKLIIEVDGHKYHSDRLTHVRDRQRDRIVKREGYETLRFAAVEVLDDPDHVAHEIVGFIARARGRA
jgi:very-short-patch-repair endonuclease